MATKTLRFNGQQIGDLVIVHSPDHRALTPPIDVPGLFQADAEINTDSRNLSYGLVVTVFVKRANEDALGAVISAIQQYVGLRGAVQVRLGGAVKVETDDTWCLADAPAPPLEPAYGGRFTDRLVLTFKGPTPPRYT